MRHVSGFGGLEYGIVDVQMIGGGCLCVADTHTEALDVFLTSLSSFEVTFGLRAALNALEGPILRSVSGFGSLEYGIVDAEMIGSGCLCVPNTRKKVLDDFCNLLVSV